VLEEDVPFEAFGRTAVQAAKQRIIQRVREGERARIREEFADKVGELLSGEVQQIERGKIVVMLASSVRPKRSFPTASRTTASISTRETRFAPC